MMFFVDLMAWSILACQATPQSTPSDKCVRVMYECQIYELQSGKNPDDAFETCVEQLDPELIQWRF
jgi:hypothetical protein